MAEDGGDAQRPGGATPGPSETEHHDSLAADTEEGRSHGPGTADDGETVPSSEPAAPTSSDAGNARDFEADVGDDRSGVSSAEVVTDHSRREESSQPDDPDIKVAHIGYRGTILAAILGAAIAAITTAAVTWFTADQQADRRQKDEQRVAFGLGRVMAEDFDNATRRLCQVGHDGAFLKQAPHLRPRLTAHDLRLVAGQLTTSEWRAVAEADASLGLWESFYRSFKGEPINWDDWGLHNIVDSTLAARKKLARLASYPAPQRPPKRWHCNHSEWRRWGVDAERPPG